MGSGQYKYIPIYSANYSSIYSERGWVSASRFQIANVLFIFYILLSAGTFEFINVYIFTQVKVV